MPSEKEGIQRCAIHRKVCCVILAALPFVEPRAMLHHLLTAGTQQVSRGSHGVMVSTLDSESSDLSSNLSGTSAAFGTHTPFLTGLSSQENSAFLGALLHSFASVFLLASPPPLCYPPALCSTLPTPPRPCLLLTEPWHPLE